MSATTVVGSSLAAAEVGDSFTSAGHGSDGGAGVDAWVSLKRDSKAGVGWAQEKRSDGSPGARAGGSSSAGGWRPPRTGDRSPPPPRQGTVRPTVQGAEGQTRQESQGLTG